MYLSGRRGLASCVAGNLIICRFCASPPLKRYSHKIPVQLVRGHFLQQRLQAAFEEHLKAEVIFNDQRGLQTAIYDLHMVRISEP